MDFAIIAFRYLEARNREVEKHSSTDYVHFLLPKWIGIHSRSAGDIPPAPVHIRPHGVAGGEDADAGHVIAVAVVVHVREAARFARAAGELKRRVHAFGLGYQHPERAVIIRIRHVLVRFDDVADRAESVEFVMLKFASRPACPP